MTPEFERGINWYKHLFITAVVLIFGGALLGSITHSFAVAISVGALGLLSAIIGFVVLVVSGRHEDKDTDRLLQQGLENIRRRSHGEPPQ